MSCRGGWAPAVEEGGRSSASNGIGQGARGLRPRGRPFEEEVPTVPNGTRCVGLDVDAAQAGVRGARELGRGGSADDRDGPRSAPGADHGRVDRHGDRRDRPRARDAGAPRERAAVPGPLRRPASSRWRWRRRRAGGSWSRSCARSVPGRIWPSRRRPARGAATRSAPRPTARTRGTCASC